MGKSARVLQSWTRPHAQKRNWNKSISEKCLHAVTIQRMKRRDLTVMSTVLLQRRTHCVVKMFMCWSRAKEGEDSVEKTQADNEGHGCSRQEGIGWERKIDRKGNKSNSKDITGMQYGNTKTTFTGMLSGNTKAPCTGNVIREHIKQHSRDEESCLGCLLPKKKKKKNPLMLSQPMSVALHHGANTSRPRLDADHTSTKSTVTCVIL